jgi:hypothetical protein
LRAVTFMVAGSGFEPLTFALCDLTHLAHRVGACEALRFPHFRLPNVAHSASGKH